MKVALNLLILCVVIIGGASMARSQTPSKALINPPSWIMGKWNNTMESNTNAFEWFTFTADEIQFEKGILEKKELIDFSKRFKQYQVKETVEPRLYRVEFLRGKNAILYEFKLKTMGPGFKGQDALTYSITWNNKVVEQHSTVLFKPSSAK